MSPGEKKETPEFRTTLLLTAIQPDEESSQNDHRVGASGFGQSHESSCDKADDVVVEQSASSADLREIESSIF